MFKGLSPDVLLIWIVDLACCLLWPTELCPTLSTLVWPSTGTVGTCLNLTGRLLCSSFLAEPGSADHLVLIIGPSLLASETPYFPDFQPVSLAALLLCWLLLPDGQISTFLSQGDFAFLCSLPRLVIHTCQLASQLSGVIAKHANS